MKEKLEKKLAAEVGVHHSCVEVLKPIHVKQGFVVEVHFYFGDFEQTESFIKIDYAQTLIDSQRSGDLQEIFTNGWKLDKAPLVEIISHKEVQSKKERKKSKIVKHSLPQTMETQKTAHVELTPYQLQEEGRNKDYDKVSVIEHVEDHQE
eukprot:215019_1